MDDHRRYVEFNSDTNTATCSKCKIEITFGDGCPEKIGGDPLADHSFDRGISITSVGIIKPDERLKPFKDFFDDA